MRPNLITVLVLNNTAAVLSLKGEAQESRILKQRVVEYRRQCLPKDDPNLGNALNNLATAFYDIDDYLGAETYFMEALEIFRKCQHSYPQIYANLLSNAGRNYTRLNQILKAEKMLQQALALQKVYLGDSHYFTTATIYRLANVRIAQEKLPQAEALIRECLASRKKFIGETDYRVGVTKHKLASLRAAQGFNVEALTLVLEAIAVFEQNTEACEPGLLVRALLFKSLLLRRLASQSDSTSAAEKMLEEAESLSQRGLELRKLLNNVDMSRPVDLEGNLDILVQPDFR